MGGGRKILKQGEAHGDQRGEAAGVGAQANALSYTSG